MQIDLHICTDRCWKNFKIDVPEEAAAECLMLPKTACRSGYWSKVSGIEIPKGRALIWSVTT